jgi:hypothetical protein
MRLVHVQVPYEVIARFECKLALMWLPSEGRFVFHDGQTGVKKFTQCTFEVRYSLFLICVCGMFPHIFPHTQENLGH